MYISYVIYQSRSGYEKRLMPVLKQQAATLRRLTDCEGVKIAKSNDTEGKFIIYARFRSHAAMENASKHILEEEHKNQAQYELFYSALSVPPECGMFTILEKI